MLARVQSYLLQGIDALPCEVEVDVDITIEREAPTVVGLPDAAVKESAERVRSAMVNSGFQWPGGRIVVNLAPADVRKEGPAYDLPIALGVLACEGVIRPPGMEASGARGPRRKGPVTFPRRVPAPASASASAPGPGPVKAPDAATGEEGELLADLDAAIGGSQPQTFEPLDPRKYLIAGELALDGRLRPVKGVIAMAALAQAMGLRGVIVPSENATEAAVVPGVEAIGASTLVEVLGLLTGQIEARPHPPLDIATMLHAASAEIDFADVRGQESVKRAIVVAAAGSHNLLGL